MNPAARTIASALRAWRRGLAVALALGLSACGTPDTKPTGPREVASAITLDGRLIQFDVLQARTLLSNRPLTGLHAQDRVVAMARRGAEGPWVVLGASGQLYQLDMAQAQLRALGSAAILSGGGREYGLGHDRATDRFRVVSDAGLNLRLNAATGAMLDNDPTRPGIQPDPTLTLNGVPTDPKSPWAGRRPMLTALAPWPQGGDRYLGIERGVGALVVVGDESLGAQGGRVQPLGLLGLGPLERAALVVSPQTGALWAALTPQGAPNARLPSRWARIDASTGKGEVQGAIGDNESIVALALP
ncbi:MAG: DUF4394 domain-containing protein [Inhella sp.]|uniref:DUF4394 domain-containing protein n=1 Tax=Inhella sp. TaxID=1921806 RepID=UPI0022C012A7|nr:DUF4394 domain-containing protein [Inhella sp.]MCZ8233586.1 DUF4394 domain-containing protein [Inhella sp.]